jgi:hypothetical protein
MGLLLKKKPFWPFLPARKSGPALPSGASWLFHVNAQEKTKKEFMESLRVGAEDMLTIEVEFNPRTQMATIEFSDPSWETEGALL